MENQFYIIRAFYLMGYGQEPEVNYFKLPSSHSDFDVIEAGDVCLTFYQNNDIITSIPALVRVEGVITNDKQVHEFLQSEKSDHIPIVPIVQIFHNFDPLIFSHLMDTFKQLDSEVKEHAEFNYVQSSIFDFLEGEN